LIANFVTLTLVAVAMGMAAQLPATASSPIVAPPITEEVV
jgi:hypothetical protein